MCARQIMTDLARRAFRRPVTRPKSRNTWSSSTQAQKQEGSFDEGLAVGIQALLVSPDFLFRIERDRPVEAGSAACSRSASTSWRRGSRTSSGPACRTRSCGARRTPARCAIPRCSPPGPAHAARPEGARAGRELRRPVAAVPRARVGDARSSDRFPDFEDYLRLSMRRRPSCSSRTSSATTAASSTSSTASTRSSTSGSRVTTAFPMSRARSSGAWI